MYDEFERAVTGRSRKGLSFLAWTGIVLAFLLLFSVVGAGWAVLHLRSEFREIAHEVRREVDREVVRSSRVMGDPAAMEILEGLDPGLDRLMSRPDEGLTLLKNLQAADLASGNLEETIEGSLRIRGEEGDVSADLMGGREGGSMVLETPEGELRLDVMRAGDGGTLVLQAPDGEVRMELEKDGDGGKLLIRTEDEVVRLGSGWGAEELPGWVPRMEGMPEAPRPIYSASSPEGALGAVTWEGDGEPRGILEFFRQEMAGAGYEVQGEHSVRSSGRLQGSFWARHPDAGRMLFVVAEARSGGPTRILLGYGQENR